MYNKHINILKKLIALLVTYGVVLWLTLIINNMGKTVTKHISSIYTYISLLVNVSVLLIVSGVLLHMTVE